MSDNVRIEFYVLPSQEAQARWRTACVLAGKGWRSGLKVFLWLPNNNDVQAFDQLLWSFRAEAFIPHSCASSADNTSAPVLLGTHENQGKACNLLINLSDQRSQQPERFSRVIEIVDQQPTRLTASREHFKAYRQAGFQPQRVEL